MTIEQVEQEFLCSLLRDAETRPLGLALKSVAFSTETHAAIHGACVALWGRDELVTVENLMAEAQCSRSLVLGLWGHEALLARPLMPAEYAARCIIDAAAARRAETMARVFLDSCIDAQRSGDMRAASQHLRRMTDYVRRCLVLTGEARKPSEFLAAVDLDHHWLVPGVLERGDRLMVVAAEGSGKSWLVRQWAVMLACGAHWFLGQRMPPGRALLIDCENSDPEIGRDLRGLARLAETFDEGWEDRFDLVTEPRGLDLLNERDVQRVEALLANYQPDLLVIGPLYRIAGDDAGAGYERHARALQQRFDEWRQRFGCALLIEAHAGKTRDDKGKRTLEVIGSSAWMRWPEVSLGLRWDPQEHCFDIGSARAGHRGARIFPPRLSRGDRTRGEWSWVADWSKAEGGRLRLQGINDGALALFRDVNGIEDPDRF
jgi:replicative DNA helicase